MPQNLSNGNYTEKWFGAAEVWTSGNLICYHAASV